MGSEGKVATRIVNGFRFGMDPGLVEVYRSEHEPLTVRWIQAYLQPGMVAIDVGAHIGVLTLVMARAVGVTGRVHAFEPGSIERSHLIENLQANSVENVIVHEEALGPMTGKRDFHLSTISLMQGFWEHPWSPTSRIVQVPQAPLDSFISAADLVKIDVEGAELEVLRGMDGLVSRSEAPPVLVVEWNPECIAASGSDPEELIDHLQERGYDLWVIDEEGARVMDITESKETVRASKRPHEWYGNLICEPPGREVPVRLSKI